MKRKLTAVDEGGVVLMPFIKEESVVAVFNITILSKLLLLRNSALDIPVRSVAVPPLMATFGLLSVGDELLLLVHATKPSIETATKKMLNLLFICYVFICEKRSKCICANFSQKVITKHFQRAAMVF